MIEDHSEYAKSYYKKKLASSAITLPQRGPKQCQWSPYQDNGGTVAALCGKGYAIAAADTRLNGDFCINTRSDESKMFPLTGTTILASAGMQADRLHLQSILQYRIQWYKYNNGGNCPSTNAIAQLLSTILYQRRFFPIYTFNILVGLDANGDGICYEYDAVGCTEPTKNGTAGSGQTIMQPLIDCLVGRKNMVHQAPAELSKNEALTLLKNAFTGAAERDCFTGDSVRFYIITPQGVEEDTLKLRKD